MRSSTRRKRKALAKQEAAAKQRAFLVANCRTMDLDTGIVSEPVATVFLNPAESVKFCQRMTEDTDG